MIRKKAKEGYLLVYKTDEYITVTPAVSAPDGTDGAGGGRKPDSAGGNAEHDGFSGQ